MNKIKNRTIDTLDYKDYDTNNATDQQTLLKALQKANPTLTNADLDDVHFMGKTTIPSSETDPTVVQMQVRVGSAQSQVLDMQFQVSHQAQVDHIVSEITNKTVNNLAYNNYDTNNRKLGKKISTPLSK